MWQDLVTPRATAFSGERIIWPQLSLEAEGPSGDIGVPGQNWRWQGGPPGEFSTGHGSRDEHQTDSKMNRRHSIAGPGMSLPLPADRPKKSSGP